VTSELFSCDSAYSDVHTPMQAGRDSQEGTCDKGTCEKGTYCQGKAIDTEFCSIW